jgi:hypothetical protein
VREPVRKSYAILLLDIRQTPYFRGVAVVRPSAMSRVIREAELREQFERNRAQFLITELSTALTFCEVAKSSDDPEKTRRNVKNAREGYDTVLKFQDGVQLDAQAKTEFENKFSHLKSELQALGENV